MSTMRAPIITGSTRQTIAAKAWKRGSAVRKQSLPLTCSTCAQDSAFAA